LARKTPGISIGKPVEVDMDWKNPLRSTATTVDADVLNVLAETYEPVTENQLERLAGRSYAQVSAVAGRLVEDGMVLKEQHGRTYSYRLNRDHVLALGLFDILSAPSRIEDKIWDSDEEWDPPPETVALFGPIACREAAPDSDIDVLVIRPDRVRYDDPAWRAQVGDLENMVEERTGNRVHLVEFDQSELVEAVRTKQPLIESLRLDVRTLFGEEIRARLGRQGPR
jgi:predicted nucleotidyltransferase